MPVAIDRLCAARHDAAVTSPASPPPRLLRLFHAFVALESAGGILLLVCTMVALAWANSPWAASYHATWATEVHLGLGSVHLPHSVLHWINDGLMAVFFLVVGLEIKRELLLGELSSPRKAALPLVAAFGGMVVPALVFVGVVLSMKSPAAARGWAVPMATDIAFALGVLAILGKRVSPGLKVFLTALAIADDLGAVLVIAVFYTSGVSAAALGAAAALLAALAAGNLLGVRRTPFYAVLGVALWLAVLQSGVHATVAGVLLALTIPARAAPPAAPLLHRLEHALHPWVAFAIMPVFALANAGVGVRGGPAALLDPVAVAVLLGLWLGKMLGVFAAAWLAVRAGLARLPAGATWRQAFGVCCLCGIGFTMSLFIAGLAFDAPAKLDAAKLGILVGSLASAATGVAVLMTGRRAGARTIA